MGVIRVPGTADTGTLDLGNGADSGSGVEDMVKPGGSFSIVSW